MSDAGPGIANPRLARFKADVQAAQQAYSAIMATAWEQVLAGNLPQCVYWRLADGDLLTGTGELVAAATARWDAGE